MTSVASEKIGRQRVSLRAVVTGWLALMTAMLLYLSSYAAKPGAKGAPQDVWPRESALALDAERPTLVVFVHPHCPCSQASVSELERLAARTQRAARMYAVAVTAKGLPDNWKESALVTRLRQIPEAEFRVDDSGVEARRFGAETSGAVYLFGADGRRLFEGGVTAARAHEGDNAGLLAVEDVLNGRVPRTRETAVYGCPLFGPSSR